MTRKNHDNRESVSASPPRQAEPCREKVEDKPDIAYVLPGLFLSGGISVALRHVLELRKQGRKAAIFCQNMEHDSSWCPFIDSIPVFPFSSYYPVCGEAGADHLVATWWETAFDVATLDARRKHYFLQSIESRFFPESHPYHSAFYLSLLLGLNIFTEARWIRDWLKSEAGLGALVTPNGVDLSVFHPSENVEPHEKLRVLVEGSTNQAIKGIHESFQALKGLDVETWYVSPDDDPDPAWKIDRFFKAVPFRKMQEIYSQCDVLLKLSKVEGVFGPPLEMMACGGTCVVWNVTGADEYCVSEKNCLMVESGSIEAARSAIERLALDKDLLKRLKAEGPPTAADLTWDNTASVLNSRVFVESLETEDPTLSQTIRNACVDMKRHLGKNLQMRVSLDEAKSVREKMENSLRDSEKQIKRLTRDLEASTVMLQHTTGQRDHIQARLEAIEAEWHRDRAVLDEIRSSVGWRFLQKIYSLVGILAPEGSLRRKFLDQKERLKIVKRKNLVDRHRV